MAEKDRNRTPYKQISDYLACSNCSEPYDLEQHEPKMLPCQHTFCIKCVQDMVDTNFDSDELSCPICGSRVECPVTAGTLPKNLAIADIMEIMAGGKGNKSGEGGGNLSNHATEATKNDVGTSYSSPLTCQKHEMGATNVCLQCNVYLCPKCFVSGSSKTWDHSSFPPHFCHAIEEVDAALSRMERELQTKHDAVQAYLRDRRAQIERDIKRSKKLCAEMEAKVHEKCLEMMRQAEEWEKRMKAQIQAVKSKHRKLADSKLLVLKYEEALCTSLWRNGREKVEAQDLQALKVINVFDEIKKASAGEIKMKTVSTKFFIPTRRTIKK